MRDFYEVKEGQIIPANALGLLLCGIEAVDDEAHFIRSNASGHLLVDVAAMAVGEVDTELTTEDVDLGGGTDTQAIVVPAFAASGGHTTVSATNPLPVDTELTDAIALGDGKVNPTWTGIAAYVHARTSDATTYDRVSNEPAISDNDGIHVTDDQALHTMLCPKRYTVNLSGLEQTYNSITSFPVNSAATDSRRFTKGRFYFDLDSTGSPQDISFILQLSPDGGTTWFNEVVWWWSNAIYDDTICASQIFRCLPFETHGAEEVRIQVQGNIASGSFAITEAHLTLQAA
jgi:hypothetical protein